MKSKQSSTSMDRNTALELVKKGATLLLLGVPQHTIFGIDTQMVSVGPMFKGIKMIPPGPHFVWCRSANKEGNEFSPTVGFFIVTALSEVIVRVWHQQEERLVKVSEDEEAMYCEAARRFEFDNQLGPYALESYGDWRKLSSYITKIVIEKIEPIGGEITVAFESELEEEFNKTEMEKKLMEQIKVSKFSKRDSINSFNRKCYYTVIPRLVKDKSISGQDLTKLNMDKTVLLDNLLITEYGGKEELILGELQFAFIAFMMGQSLQAFLQWKALVNIFLSCTEAPLRTRTQLFTKFMEVIFYQLTHGFHKGQKNIAAEVGSSVFLDDAWFSKDVFLYHLFKEFFPLVLKASVVHGDLLLWTRKLKELLEITFGWEFEEGEIYSFCEDDEFSPVVVLPDECNL